MHNKTFIIASSILAVVSIIGFLSYLPKRTDAALKIKMADFPRTIGEWQGTDMPLSEKDYEILETRNLIMRQYKNPAGESVYLYIVYSEDNRRVAHPPEICYSGGGATIIEKSIMPITNSITANKFTIENKDSRQLVIYWFKSTTLNTYSYFKQQLKIVTDRMLGRKTSSALVRVSTQIKDNNQNAALNLIKSFTLQIEPLLAQYVP